MLSFVLCDDNQSAIDKLSKMLDSIIISHNLKAQISYTTTNPIELLQYTKTHPTDVLLLDIDLKSSTSGLQIAEQIREIDKNIYIIFVTGHFEFGMVAYKYKTFDFLQKPLTKERFEETILRLYSDIFGSTAKYIRLDNDKTVIKENSIRFPEDLKIGEVLESSVFILGSEVSSFEKEISEYVGRGYCAGCGNGTDALSLALTALGIGPGDAVFVPAFTFFATAETVSKCGAQPVFVDIDIDTFNMSASSLSEKIEYVLK